MATSTIHSPSDLELTKIAISQDELRAILSQIESEFCQSEIYQRAVGGLQKRLDRASVNVHLLIKALGREAIRLALRQVVQQYCEEVTQSGPSSSSQSATVESSPSPSPTSPSFIPQSAHQRAPSHPVASQAAAEGSVTKEAKPAPYSRFQLSPLPTPNPENAALSDDSLEQKEVSSGGFSDTQNAKNDDLKNLQPTPSRPIIRVSGRSTNHSTEDQSPNQAARSEALHQIGQSLLQARLRKSWSIHDIHQHTRVPLHQIQSLENGEIEHLPEDIYVRGFIRRIAEVVDLDSTALLDILPHPAHEANFPPTWHPSTYARDSVPELKTKTLKNQHQLGPRHLYLGYAVLMTGAAGGLTWIAQQPIDGLNLDSFSLEALPEIPEFINNLAPIQVLQQEMQNFSQGRSQPHTQGAIAQPETIPVESSTHPDRDIR
ncbi:MAG: helix-turn-helix domain-containing protein [Elainellaceae cyanobacterium]